MILPFSQVKNFDAVGNKAKSLILMRNNGFNVPDGFVLDCDFYKELLRFNGIDKDIQTLLKYLTVQNVEETSEKIRNLTYKIEFDENSRKKIEALLKDGKKYAVRSSAIKEDLDEISFAGQYDTYLNVKKDELEKDVIKCYSSMFSPHALTYILESGIKSEETAMCVIVQEMIDSFFSGVCFTVDPVSGKDTQMLIETAPGLGENVVSGKVSPKQSRYDWYLNILEKDDNDYFSEEELLNAAHTFLDVQLFFGYPCDIEFAVKNGKLYILQARKITKIGYSSLRDLWTTADFKDGISAKACKTLMWSLYEYALDYSLRKFFLDLKMIPEKNISPKLSNMFFARGYWNLSDVKKALEPIIGYDEKQFENDYGITTYDFSDDEKVKTSLIHSMRVYLAYKKVDRYREKNNEIIKQKLIARCIQYEKKINISDEETIKKDWHTLTEKDFLKSESNYFSLIYLNTVHRSVTGKTVSSLVSDNERIKLFGNLDNISHLRPFYELWTLSRKIRNDEELFEKFKEKDVSELMVITKSQRKELYDEFEQIVKRYGYHSNSELDLTGERFSEKPEILFSVLKDTVMLSDEFSSENDKIRSEKERNEILSRVKSKISERQFKKFISEVEKNRKTLWWREELRDVSTRYYSVIRSYTLKFAEILLKENAIDKIDDVWYLKAGDIWNYLDGKISKEELSQLSRKNRIYYNCFINYISDNEIGNFKRKEQKKYGKSNKMLSGVCANGGKVTGVARVIESFDDIGKIKEKDILVTKNTDTGWTPKFAVLSGIVTENGGTLCHCAIVSREYNIPAIVGCEGATSKIKDGQIITVDGDNAVVITEGQR